MASLFGSFASTAYAEEVIIEATDLNDSNTYFGLSVWGAKPVVYGPTTFKFGKTDRTNYYGFYESLMADVEIQGFDLNIDPSLFASGQKSVHGLYVTTTSDTPITHNLIVKNPHISMHAGATSVGGGEIVLATLRKPDKSYPTEPDPKKTARVEFIGSLDKRAPNFDVSNYTGTVDGVFVGIDSEYVFTNGLVFYLENVSSQNFSAVDLAGDIDSGHINNTFIDIARSTFTDSTILLNSQNVKNATISGSEVMVMGSHFSQGLIGINRLDDGKENSSEIKNNMLSTMESTAQSLYGIKVQNPATLTASYNTLNLRGTQVLVDQNSSVVGVFIENITEDSLDAATLNGNVLSLQNSKVRGGVFVIGYGTADAIKGYNKGTGNTLIASGINSMSWIDGFNNLTLSVSKDNKDTAILTFTDTDEHIIADKKIVIEAEETVEANVAYKLMEVMQGAGTVTLKNSDLSYAGTFMEVSHHIDEEAIKSGEILSFTFEEKPAPEPEPEPSPDPDPEPGDKPQTQVLETSKTLSESLLGTIAFVNQGAEFIADEGLSSMVSAAQGDRVTAFGAMTGGTSRYKTGSHVDVDGMTMATGATVVIDKAILAGFIEAGWGESDSHVEGTKAEGDHNYYGVGVASRYNVTEALHIDGSVRVGVAATEFNGLYSSASAKYDVDNLYASAHLGVGYTLPLTANVSADLYGRYTLSYLEGDETDLGTKARESFEYDDTVTHAFRVGVRMNGKACDYANWYAGLAYEHVADGDAEGKVASKLLGSASLDVPSLEGDTAIMDVGVRMVPSQNSPWQINVGVKGYAGDREGVTGNVSVNYRF